MLTTDTNVLELACDEVEIALVLGLWLDELVDLGVVEVPAVVVVVVVVALVVDGVGVGVAVDLTVVDTPASHMSGTSRL